MHRKVEKGHRALLIKDVGVGHRAGFIKDVGVGHRAGFIKDEGAGLRARPYNKGVQYASKKTIKIEGI